MSATPAYDALKAHRLRIYNLEHVQAIATWDRMTYMPSGGADARAQAQAEMAAIIQNMQCGPELDDWLDQAASENLDSEDRANLALMERDRVIARAVPEELVVRRTRAIGAAAQVWPQARTGNNWTSFAAVLEPVVHCIRETAERLGDALGVGRYDALLDGFDRGLRGVEVRALFGEIADWLPQAVAQALARQDKETAPIVPAGPFDVQSQHRLCSQLMEALGFDFGAGRLDASRHPFTGGTPDDVRLTTCFRTDQCLTSLAAIVHESGHGLYQAGLPRRWRGQPLGEPCSASLHEAQALVFERQLAPTPAFAALLSRLLVETFGWQPAFEPDNIVKLAQRVSPGLIRVEADELTYPAHIILRTEIEMALIEREIEVDDIPALWDEKMGRLLGVDSRGNFADGPLQDIHWSQGMFGYFPAYLLGAMAAAQLFAGFEKSREAEGAEPPPVEALRHWLEDRVWSQGAKLTTNALMRSATGTPLSADALRAHLRSRYGLS